MARDMYEPIAHVVQAYDQTITLDNASTNYLDVINIVESLVSHALSITTSISERHRYNRILECIADDVRICKL